MCKCVICNLQLVAGASTHISLKRGNFYFELAYLSQKINKYYDLPSLNQNAYEVIFSNSPSIERKLLYCYILDILLIYWILICCTKLFNIQHYNFLLNVSFFLICVLRYFNIMNFKKYFIVILTLKKFPSNLDNKILNTSILLNIKTTFL